MPRLWTYLIKKFLFQFSFTLFGIICFLIVIRFNSIAGFATSGTDFWLILNFVGLLIPYVLPFAIPISALNASLLLSRKLSQEKQFTALRSGGLSLKFVFLPLVCIFVVLSMVNFFTAGTLAPLSKIKSKALVYDTTLEHPLFITQKSCPIKIKALYTDVGKMSSKDSAHDLVLAFKNKKNERLSLLVADKLSVKNGILKGKNLAIISSLKSTNPSLQDDLVIENEAFMTTSTQVVDALLYKDEAVDGVDYMDFFQLLGNLHKKAYYKTEIYKRLNIALAPLSFGLLGLCFGLSISRQSSNLSLATAIGLATIFMITVVSSKSIRSQSLFCLMLFAGVQSLLFIASYLKLRRVERGLG
jgi:lipopolysaccharide export LptBFGC system permease protein LptF